MGIHWKRLLLSSVFIAALRFYPVIFFLFYYTPKEKKCQNKGLKYYKFYEKYIKYTATKGHWQVKNGIARRKLGGKGCPRDREKRSLLRLQGILPVRQRLPCSFSTKFM